jgi:F0F1-type ATP synthase assembly protein I
MKQYLLRATKQSEERRALNNGAGEALSRAFELALTPTLMGGLGWLLDNWLGTWPWIALFFFVFTFCYLMWKYAKGYDAEMRAHERQMFAPKPKPSPTPKGLP